MAALPQDLHELEPERPVGTPIEDVPQLERYRPALTALGYVTLEHLLFGYEVAAKELSAVLKADIPKLIASIDMPSTAIPPEELERLIAAEYAMGVAIESLTPPEEAPYFSISAPEAQPPDVNLIPEMPPIRHQGDRGTCVAHAALSAFEHFSSRHGRYRDLSEQFCYWSCKQNDGQRDSPGTRLRIAIPLLERNGCCTEETWPYDPIPKNKE